jgi:hypothetical protein
MPLRLAFERIQMSGELKFDVEQRHEKKLGDPHIMPVSFQPLDQFELLFNAPLRMFDLPTSLLKLF